jgi:hypothetical protein
MRTVNCVLKTTLIVSLFALGALSAPAANATSVDLDCKKLCYWISSCERPVQGGGVVGATVNYASDEVVIACNAAKMEITILLNTAAAACDATTDYLFGGHCDTTCTCDPQPIEPISLQDLVAVSSNSATWAPLRCYIGGGGGGVVGQTLDYASRMANISCNAAAGTAMVGLYATFATCNNTGDYLFGQEHWCTVYWTN